jgi:hypothetical protein
MARQAGDTRPADAAEARHADVGPGLGPGLGLRRSLTLPYAVLYGIGSPLGGAAVGLPSGTTGALRLRPGTEKLRHGVPVKRSSRHRRSEACVIEILSAPSYTSF